MRIILAAVVTALFLVLLMIPGLKKYMGYIMAAYGCVFLMLVGIWTYRTADSLVPFYHAKDQLFYQREFEKDGYYPDAFLQVFVKNRMVYIKNDLADYVRETKKPDDFYEDGKFWLYRFYHQTNLSEFLEANGAYVVADDSLDDKYINENQMDDFTFAGYGNDMFRFLFNLSQEDEEWGNSFYYYWYYSTYLDEMKVYINVDDIADAGEIVCLWDDSENETLYFMSKEYYEREVADND